MSDIKTVNVQVESGSTEHALLTGAKKTRKRAAKRLEPETTAPEQPNSNSGVKVTKAGPTAVAQSALSPSVTATPSPVQQPSLGPPQPPATPVIVAPAVKIAPKNGTQAPPTPAPRLLPKKRIGTAPAAETLKAKPKFVVESAAAAATAPAPAEDSQQGGTRAPEMPTSGSNRAGGVRSRTRRAFKERRISLTVQPLKKSRKYRRTLRARVAEMPLQQVRRMLLRKGVLKPKADVEKAPPEEMMRSMLVDYMMLHHAE